MRAGLTEVRNTRNATPIERRSHYVRMTPAATPVTYVAYLRTEKTSRQKEMGHACGRLITVSGVLTTMHVDLVVS